MSQQINLFNPIFLKRPKEFSARAMVEAVVLILLGSIGVYGYAWFQVAKLEQDLDDAHSRLQFEEMRMSRMTKELPTRERSKQLAEELRQLEVQVQRRREVAGLLTAGAFGTPQGFSEYMRAFSRQAMHGVWLTGFSISGSGREIGIRGRALSAELVPVYIGHLTREPVLQGGQFSSLEISAGATAERYPYLEFRVRAQGQGGAR